MRPRTPPKRETTPPNNPAPAQQETDVPQDTARGDAVFADAEVRLCVLVDWLWLHALLPFGAVMWHATGPGTAE